jgi:succinyl-diaminopimelate desuccinylase
VSINSVKGEPQEGAPYGIGPRFALTVAAQIAEKYGFSAKILGDRVCVIELGEGEPELGILAHLDVVPPAGDWNVTEPFRLTVKDGVMYGRGVADDKGPAIAALYALRAVKELDLPINHKVQLILGSDEEKGSSDIKWYMENYKMPPKVFTPDGSFPVVNTEKGHLKLTITTAPESETEGAHIVKLEGGSVSNAVPATCTALLKGVTAEEVLNAAKGIGAEFEATNDGDTVTVLCRGRASHASLPDKGINAIAAMCGCLSALKLSDSAITRAVNALNKALPLGDNGGHAFGAYCSDKASGVLTVNLGVISYSSESGLEAQVDSRVPICGNGLAIADALQSALGDSASVKVNWNAPPHNTPTESDFVQGLLEIYEEHTGSKAEAIAIGGGTYVHDIEGGVAFGCCFDGTEYHEHEPDECMPVGELILAGRMFTEAIVKFCG